MVLLHCDHTQLVDTGVFFAFFFSGGQGSQQDASDGQRSLHSSAADRQQHFVAQVVFSTWLQHDNIVDVWYTCSTCSSWELYRNKHSLNCVFDVLNACSDIQYTYERTCVWAECFLARCSIWFCRFQGLWSLRLSMSVPFRIAVLKDFVRSSCWFYMRSSKHFGGCVHVLSAWYGRYFYCRTMSYTSSSLTLLS